MKNINDEIKPTDTLLTPLDESELSYGDLPMIYIRPTVDNRIAVWPGHRMEVDPRPGDCVVHFDTIEETEKKLPEIMEAIGEYFGVAYIYIDRMNKNKGK